MSENLMSTMYSLGEMPWHKNAFVSTVEMGAVEASSVIESVSYEKRPVTVVLNGVAQETKDFAIVRSAIPSDPKERILGFVKKNYNILQPLDICIEYDRGIKNPVETIGFLGKGEKLFLTWKLPSIDVRGDEIRLFGFVASGYDGKFGASLHLVTVRVVCSNTFAMAINESESNKVEGRGRVWSGRHNSTNLARDLGIWMEHVNDKSLGKVQTASDMFNAMAAKAMNNQALTSILNKVYPDPKPLPVDFPGKLREENQEGIDKLAENAERDRNAVSALFGGQGIAITPDGFGLFNSVTEHENHTRMTKKPANQSILFGNRAKTMTTAANVIYAWATKK